MECECKDWACEDANLVNDSGHHPRCPKYREIVFWDKDNQERLSFTDKNEAIQNVIEYYSDASEGFIEICGYAYMKLPKTEFMADNVLDHLLEYDLEEYIDPDKGIGDYITDKMREAAIEFVKVFKAEFKPWACEVVTRQTINVEDWIKEHRPDWLEE